MAQSLLAGHPLLLPDGTKVPASEHLEGKATLLYFSAHWCGPCRQFTPYLKKFYEELKAEGNTQLEVVFVSWDETAAEQADYFRSAHGQWAQLEFDDPIKKELAEKYHVKGIPALKLIRPDGTEAVKNCVPEFPLPLVRYCDICRDPVADIWFQCQQCDDYDVCLKCKTHLQFSPEHQFEEVKRAEMEKKKPTSSELWDKLMEKYNDLSSNDSNETEKTAEATQS